MKWIIGTLIFLIVGWQVAVFLFNRNSSENANLMTTDSLQAKAPLPFHTTVHPNVDSLKTGENSVDTVLKNKISLPKGSIDTKGVNPKEVVAFAKTLIGVPYLYGSTNPEKGFDCSGFITHVFSRFGIVVPRSSIDFTHVGKEISAKQAREGDLILFTGTDSTERFVGHMGIVVSNTDTLRFIHSTSGKQYGVTITPLNSYYQKRYAKTIRIFPD
jgi:cell wall-associated NlpC family hydrolase